MTRLMRAELRKILATRLWLWLLVAAMALATLFTSLMIVFSTEAGTWTHPLDSPEGQRTLFGSGQGAVAALTMVLGAVVATAEFRHRTATATFLATPRRGRVLAAKLLTMTLVAVGYAVVVLGVITAVALPWLAAEDITLSLTGDGVPATMLGVVAVAVLYGLIGVGLGALIREQVATVVGVLIYLYLVEPVVSQIPSWSEWTRFLPGRAAEALAQASLRSGLSVGGIEPWQAGLVLTGYASLIVTAARVWTLRRDLT